MLIAIMGDSYEKVKESERVEAIRERARIVVEMEKRSPKSHRYHRFMHFVEMADTAGRRHEIAWEGVTRRVTDVMRTETSQLESELNTKLNTKLELMDNGMKNKFELMDTKLESMDNELKGMKNKFESLDGKLDTILASLK